MSRRGLYIGSAFRNVVRRETGDSDGWLGADCDWQVSYLFHSSLGDSLSILDRLLWEGLGLR